MSAKIPSIFSVILKGLGFPDDATSRENTGDNGVVVLEEDKAETAQDEAEKPKEHDQDFLDTQAVWLRSVQLDWGKIRDVPAKFINKNMVDVALTQDLKAITLVPLKFITEEWAAKVFVERSENSERLVARLIDEDGVKFLKKMVDHLLQIVSSKEASGVRILRSGHPEGRGVGISDMHHRNNVHLRLTLPTMPDGGDESPRWYSHPFWFGDEREFVLDSSKPISRFIEFLMSDAAWSEKVFLAIAKVNPDLAFDRHILAATNDAGRYKIPDKILQEIILGDTDFYSRLTNFINSQNDSLKKFASNQDLMEQLKSPQALLNSLVEVDGLLIKYINPEDITVSVARKAMEQNPLAFHFLPDAFREDDRIRHIAMSADVDVGGNGNGNDNDNTAPGVR
jgi:hypothetical protein